MFYAMTGAKFSGKDTVARAIINELALRGNTAEKVSFAGPLKGALCVMFGWTYEQIENHEFKETPEPITGKTPRKIMQLLGTEFGRETLHPELWLRIALSTMRKMECNGIVPIITDVRFENEAEFVRSHGGTLIHVVNPETVSRTDAHASENGVAFVEGDILFTNDKTAGLQPIMDFAARLIRP